MEKWIRFVAALLPSATTVFHDLGWPLAVVVIVVFLGIGWRKSISKLILGARLKKLPGGLEFDAAPQQQIEPPKEDVQLVPATIVPAAVTADAAAINDPVLGPRIRAIRADLDKQPSDPAIREGLLVHALAVSQVNHENARIARFIFGSQLDILNHLNARSATGETLQNIRAFYDKAVQDFPAFYSSYSFESYLAFLETQQLVIREDQQLKITPRGQALLHYMIATGDTSPRQS
jgi:hypothetical protein